MVKEQAQKIQQKDAEIAALKYDMFSLLIKIENELFCDSKNSNLIECGLFIL